MKIYFAGPLFSDAEKEFNNRVASQIEKLGYTVFLPQRDGAEHNKPPFDTMKPDEYRKALFDLDKSQVMASDIFLFILDGRVPDDGACVELGLAHLHKQLADNDKYLIGLRTGHLSVNLNPMIKMALDRIYESVPELLDALKEIKEH